jgi:hypothetical protein
MLRNPQSFTYFECSWPNQFTCKLQHNLWALSVRTGRLLSGKGTLAVISKDCRSMEEKHYEDENIRLFTNLEKEFVSKEHLIVECNL